MNKYRLQEAELAIPHAWRDNSVNAFVIPAVPGGSPASFVVTRDANAEIAEVQSYADQQLVTAAQNLRGYKLVSRKPVQIDDQPGIQTDYSWTTPEKVSVHQRQAYVRQNGQFLIFTLTAKTTEFHRYEEHWKSVLASIQLRRS